MKRHIRVKTFDEIERLANGGAILREVLEQVAGMAKPGVTGKELDAEAERRLLAKGAKPAFKGYSPSGDPKDAFPATLCISVNSAVVHGIPNDTPFKEGDLVSFDIGCEYDGLYTDTATTVSIGNVSETTRRLIEVTKESLEAAVKVVKPGVRTGDIGAAVQAVAEKAGFGIVRDLVGHGVGYEIHEFPNLPNYGRKGEGIEIPLGLLIAIEPMLVEGSYEIEVADDNWTVLTKDRKLAAHEEYTMAVVPDGVRVLTKI